nr:T9SS type A sorting domain-containing protein [Ignavibacteria bacterium]
VKLHVYDVSGRLIQVLLENNLQAGEYEIEFHGTALPSGVYYYRLESGSYCETKKMVLLK